MVILPVSRKVGFFMIQFGITSAENMEKPNIKIFREEFISVDCHVRCVSKTQIVAKILMI